MAKITELPAAGPITGPETLPIVQDGETRRASLNALLGEDGETIIALATATALAARDDAQDAAEGAAAISRYYPTFAAAIAAVAVGQMFTSDEGGVLSIYRRIVGAPFYEFYDVVASGAALAALEAAYLSGPPLLLEYGNPTLDGGLVSPTDTISKSTKVTSHTLTGTRTKAQIAHSIQILDNQTGPESGPGTPTPQSASYGLSIVGIRPDWNTSTLTGEMNGISVLLRQARSDSAAILSNIGVQSGFTATVESLTFAADSSGAPIKGVNTQLGVANPRDNAYYGLVVQSAYGADLTAGVRISETPGTSWVRPLEITNAAGQDVIYVRGADGAMFTRTVAPTVQYGGNLGADTLEYNTAYLRFMKLKVVNFASLPSPGSAPGMIARIDDASAAITTFNQIVSAGGGANTALVTSDGTNWRALSS